MGLTGLPASVLKRLFATFGLGGDDSPFAIRPDHGRRSFVPLALLEPQDEEEAGQTRSHGGEAAAAGTLDLHGLEIPRIAPPRGGSGQTGGEDDEGIDFLARRLRESTRRTAVVESFDAAHPVSRRDGLLGRERQLEKLTHGVVDKREHAIIHGTRGSGKTSLARIFGDYADQQGLSVVYLLCEPIDRFAELISPCFDYLPGYVLDRRRLTPEIMAHPGQLTSFLAENLQERVLLILDEFDRITDPSVLSQMATFLKLLADGSVSMQVCLVGIASSRDELIGYHPSLRRHMTAVSVEPLSNDECLSIIERGARRIGVDFTTEATRLILDAAAGSPYHVRLFCQSAGYAMLRRGGVAIDGESVREGLRQALESWGELNADDYGRFSRLCQRDAMTRDKVLRFTRMVIEQNNRDDGGEGEAMPAPESLKGSLVTDLRSVGRTIFSDSLAPQFLLAMLLLENSRNDNQMAAGRTA